MQHQSRVVGRKRLQIHFTHRQIQSALTILTGVSFKSALDFSEDLVREFLPTDAAWLELMHCVASYGVQDSSRIIRESYDSSSF